MGIGTLLIRADASAAIGTGHVMRCLALAQAWQDAGGKIMFAMAASTDAIRMRLAGESCDMVRIDSSPAAAEDIRQTIALAQEIESDWIVVDGYQFGAEYQSALKGAGGKVLFLDDYGHTRQYAADVVLNQSVSASPVFYSDRAPYTRLLLGPRYAMLRREFGAWRQWKRTIPHACRRVLVTMGGSDEENVTATVIAALRLVEVAGIEATVLVGGSNPHFKEVRDQAASSGLAIDLRTDVSNVGELMAASDMAISAAGTTCWELCLLGLPSLLIDVADNQTAVAKEMQKRECAIYVGNRTVTPEALAQAIKALIDDHERRDLLSRNSRELVDGKGAARVVSVLRGSERLRLRPVREDDRYLLWEWANDPEVRGVSFSSDPIPWETHVSWFYEKMRRSRNPDPKTLIFIAEDEDAKSAGQIRFDALPGGEWEVSISLAPHVRGLGLASELIASGVREVFKDNGSARIHAHIKPGNVASVKSFERAGFRAAGTDQIRGTTAIHLIYERN